MGCERDSSLYALLILGHICPILGFMTGNEFIRKVRRLGRRRDVKVAFVSERGKGSHGTLYYGDKLTIVRNPKDELKTGTLHAMLTQLGVTLSDL
jgi:mRNA interferase HicA